MRKAKTERDIIIAAIVRALASMEDPIALPQHTYAAGEINGWKGDALASYVIPKVLRALQRHRKPKRRRPAGGSR
jgi:hypothetical protein